MCNKFVCYHHQLNTTEHITHEIEPHTIESRRSNVPMQNSTVQRTHHRFVAPDEHGIRVVYFICYWIWTRHLVFECRANLLTNIAQCAALLTSSSFRILSRCHAFFKYKYLAGLASKSVEVGHWLQQNQIFELISAQLNGVQYKINKWVTISLVCINKYTPVFWYLSTIKKAIKMPNDMDRNSVISGQNGDK